MFFLSISVFLQHWIESVFFYSHQTSFACAESVYCIHAEKNIYLFTSKRDWVFWLSRTALHLWLGVSKNLLKYFARITMLNFLLRISSTEATQAVLTFGRKCAFLQQLQALLIGGLTEIVRSLQRPVFILCVVLILKLYSDSVYALYLKWDILVMFPNDVVPLIDMFIAVLVAVIFFNNFIDCGESKESLIITKGPLRVMVSELGNWPN